MQKLEIIHLFQPLATFSCGAKSGSARLFGGDAAPQLQEHPTFFTGGPKRGPAPLCSALPPHLPFPSGSILFLRQTGISAAPDPPPPSPVPRINEGEAIAGFEAETENGLWERALANPALKTLLLQLLLL